MESEYLTLCQVLRDLIPLQKLMKEVNKEFFKRDIDIPKCSANSLLFSDIVSTEQEIPISKSKVYIS